ncbi:hypothetical protein BD770DRAFT_380158 [Pilaira anomala]|nr:hypothetical protein BD770DRAFT_380158 [Pilaira anomala]
MNRSFSTMYIMVSRALKKHYGLFLSFSVYITIFQMSNNTYDFFNADLSVNNNGRPSLYGQ